MTYTSEIEKLEKRWAENPKGRNFAPLADAYRKAGELDRAVELCKNGLALHPDYVSAHIVYGRCLIDQKNAPGATEVFRKVLELDHENVLALKILAEIAERGGRYDETVEWLTRLLKADPMNSEAPEALARAKAKANQAGPAAAGAPPAPGAVRTAAQPAPAPAAQSAPAAKAPAVMPVTLKTAAHPGAPPAKESVVRLVPETRVEPRVTPRAEPAPADPAAPPAKTSPIRKPDFVVEHEPEAPQPPAVRGKDPAGAAAGIESFDGALDFNSVAHTAAKADGLEVAEEVELKAQDLVVEGLAATAFEGGMLAVPPPPAPSPPTPRPSAQAPVVDDEPLNLDLPTIDLPLIMPDDLPPAPVAEAPPLPARRAEPRQAAPAPEPPPPPPPPPPMRPQAPAPGLAAAVALSDDDGAADTAALSRAEPVLTETMAELYLRQGHEEDARRVYEALVAQRPQDTRLRARFEALLEGTTARAGGVAGLAGGGGRGGRTGEALPAYLKRIIASHPAPFAVDSEHSPSVLPAESLDPPPAPAPAAPARSGSGSGGLGSPLERAFALAPHEPDAPTDGGAPGDATRPATDSLSLDEVFGDEGLPSAPPAPEPAASEADPAPPGAPAPGDTGGFSFDQFFHGPAREGSGAPSGGNAPKGPARPSQPKGLPPVEDEGDLDQFQAWLKGLKS